MNHGIITARAPGGTSWLCKTMEQWWGFLPSGATWELRASHIPLAMGCHQHLMWAEQGEEERWWKIKVEKGWAALSELLLCKVIDFAAERVLSHGEQS